MVKIIKQNDSEPSKFRQKLSDVDLVKRLRQRMSGKVGTIREITEEEFRKSEALEKELLDETE